MDFSSIQIGAPFNAADFSKSFFHFQCHGITSMYKADVTGCFAFLYNLALVPHMKKLKDMYTFKHYVQVKTPKALPTLFQGSYDGPVSEALPPPSISVTGSKPHSVFCYINKTNTDISD